MEKYIATEYVDGFRPGQEVPTEKGDLWCSMYVRPPVKKVNDSSVSKIVVEPPVIPTPVLAKKRGRS